jgi:hypothetical protein
LSAIDGVVWRAQLTATEAAMPTPLLPEPLWLDDSLLANPCCPPCGSPSALPLALGLLST